MPATKRGRAQRDNAPQTKKNAPEMEWIDSDSDSISSMESQAPTDTKGDQIELMETADEKRIRLAKQYLSKLESLEKQRLDDQSGSDAESITDSVLQSRVQSRLREDALAARGFLSSNVASLIEQRLSSVAVTPMRGHQLSVTSVALTEDESTVFTGSKDCSIWRWDVETGKRIKFPGRRRTKHDIRAAELAGTMGRMTKAAASGGGRAGDSLPNYGYSGHWEEVLAVAVSSDGRYLASGGRDRVVRVWDTRTNNQINALIGHRNDITSLSFQRGTNTLFSGSLDRTVKVWNISEGAYVDTLFGHEGAIHAVDALPSGKERAVSCGLDRTVRLWKVPEASQLVYRGNSLNVNLDCIAAINDSWFVTGAQNGQISLWSAGRKKPVSCIDDAHGPGHFISALGMLRNSDLLASGSDDGYLRFWRASVGRNEQGLSSVGSVAVPGFINALTFAPSGRFLIAGIGQEHRFGRWWRHGKVRNGISLIKMPFSLDEGRQTSWSSFQKDKAAQQAQFLRGLELRDAISDDEDDNETGSETSSEAEHETALENGVVEESSLPSSDGASDDDASDDTRSIEEEKSTSHEIQNHLNQDNISASASESGSVPESDDGAESADDEIQNNTAMNNTVQDSDDEETMKCSNELHTDSNSDSEELEHETQVHESSEIEYDDEKNVEISTPVSRKSTTPIARKTRAAVAAASAKKAPPRTPIQSKVNKVPQTAPQNRRGGSRAAPETPISTPARNTRASTSKTQSQAKRSQKKRTRVV